MAGLDVATLVREHLLAPYGEDGALVATLLAAGAYWDLHEEELRRHFPPEAYFDAALLRPPALAAARAALDAAVPAADDPLGAHVAAHDASGRLALLFTTHRAADPDALQLGHVNVHPDFRRRGLYREVLRRVEALAVAAGLDAVVSEHAPTNNAVLIAHLRAGFHVVALDVDAMNGPTLRLRRFLVPEQAAAFAFRCGLATVTPALAASGYGAFGRLAEQLAQVPRSEGAG